MRMKESALNLCILDILTYLSDKSETTRQLVIELNKEKKHASHQLKSAINFLKAFEYLEESGTVRGTGRNKLIINRKGTEKLKSLMADVK